ncbi:TOBE domain-containing protein [Myxosarcina sp. GI1(2024)]
MPRKKQGWITFQSSSEERQLLEAYCQQTQRSKTEVLRELLRSLEVTSESATSLSKPEAEMNTPEPFQVSARNLLKGKITRLHPNGVNTEITLEIAPQVELTSVITTTSARRLDLETGKIVYAMIKSSNVMIAVSDSLEPVAESLLA